MKRFLSLIFMPLISVILLCGCGSDKTSANIKDAYSEMVSQYIVGENNIFFSDTAKPYSIVIDYSSAIDQSINIANPSNDVQKRYKALGYQQKVLDNIFDYYHNHQEEFFLKAESMDKDDLNTLYDKVINLKNTLSDFESQYESFETALENGISDIMEFNITSYSFHLNKVIDASFNFIDCFHNLFVKYCVEDYTIYNESNLKLYVDKAYLDLSRIVYLENIKAFNYTVGDNGVCDLSSVIGSSSEFNILYILDSRGSVLPDVTDNLGTETDLGKEAMKNLNSFIYSRDVFEQRLETYKNNCNNLDMYSLNQYRFGEISNLDYESYLNTLSASDRATVVMLENFINNNFQDYVSKLNKIVG